MRYPLLSTKLQYLAAASLALSSALLLSSCETTTTRVSTRTLPAYEPPLARADFQTVRTTAYTHSEADHLVYGARNALGGRLQAASIPRGRVEVPLNSRGLSGINAADNITIAYSARSKRSTTKTKRGKADRKKKSRSSRPTPPRIGSAAADWSRWPVGTTFQLLSTGQIYRIDDYGWALAGRNTIDLYMGSRSDMNRWGVRPEKIKILAWGSAEESMRVLRPRLAHKHIQRMVLELRGEDLAAAQLR